MLQKECVALANETPFKFSSFLGDESLGFSKRKNDRSSGMNFLDERLSLLKSRCSDTSAI